MSHVYDIGYFNRDTIENKYLRLGLLRPDQYAAILYAFGYTPSGKRVERDPGVVLSIGCGAGLMEYELFQLGIEVVGLDVVDLRWYRQFPVLTGGLDALPDGFNAQTVIFCESLEHIPAEEFDRNFPRLVKMLRRSSGWLVVTNWEDYHPLEPNGVDHVMRVDDALYDRMAKCAANVVHRSGSHLVLSF